MPSLITSFLLLTSWASFSCSKDIPCKSYLWYRWKLYSGWRTRAWGHCKSHGHRGRKGQTYDSIFSNLFLTHNQDKDKSNFFLNTSNTLFLLFNFLSLQVKKTTAKLIHKGSTLTVHWTTMTQVPLIVLYAATC